ncbi:MAG: hypothetical protein ACI89J_000862 [Hyphomicrobiaceae bacterium]|jgi:hypothetical protein
MWENAVGEKFFWFFAGVCVASGFWLVLINYGGSHVMELFF